MLSVIMSGLKVAQKDLSVTANNLANAGTVGFKRSEASFVDVFANDPSANPKTAVGAGSLTNEVARDFSQGSMTSTGRSTDLAIAGQGFFVLNAADPAADTPTLVYTRAGGFGINAAGNLVSSTGARVQMIENADPATIPEPPTESSEVVNAVIQLTSEAGASLTGISIDSKGLIGVTYADNTTAYVGYVAVAKFADPSAMKAIGNSNYVPTGESGEAEFWPGGAPNAGDIMSATLEQSNVDITQELMGMLKAQQIYNGNARMLQTAMEVASRITDKI